MKNINIPEPCSENWDEMMPNEKGAFCQKCALDVYDFTNKSADEIRDVLVLNMAAPVCMRIQPSQLEELNADFSAWKMNNKQSYHRAWVFTLFVVFGLTLFSCEEDDKAVVEKFQKTGKVILTSQDKEEEIQTETVEVSAETENTVKRDDRLKDLPQIDLSLIEGGVMGKPILTTHNKELEEVEVFSQHKLEWVQVTGGVPRISPAYNVYLQDTYEGVVLNNDSIKIEEITGLVYPNPASNETTLKLNMPNKGKGAIELFALNGQKIRTIHSGRMKKGESEYQIDLTELETGLYLVVVYSGELKETIKISKI